MIVEGPLAPFNTIGLQEETNVYDALLRRPLSGYLGGELKGGINVEALEYEFAGAIGSKYAVACNSATSGLLIACMAAGVGRDTEVITTPFTMSATAAAPAFLGAGVGFQDIEDQAFCLSISKFPYWAKAIIVTNLFGHPANLQEMRSACASERTKSWKHIFLIEDNAQAPFAAEYAHHAGTIGHMGVFSFNVHKHLQAGEGGIVVTDDSDLAHRLRLYRNHAEMAGSSVGLNLRMTEVTAAICLAQLAKREQIISERIEIAETITDAIKDLPGLTGPVVRSGYRHVYYVVAIKVDEAEGGIARDRFVDAMNAEGVPLRKGYIEPLYHLPAFEKYRSECPVAERMHKTLALYENCAYTPTSQQLKQFKEAFHKVADKMLIEGVS